VGLLELPALSKRRQEMPNLLEETDQAQIGEARKAWGEEPPAHGLP
jgi:hypothetical protein